MILGYKQSLVSDEITLEIATLFAILKRCMVKCYLRLLQSIRCSFGLSAFSAVASQRFS